MAYRFILASALIGAAAMGNLDARSAVAAPIVYQGDLAFGAGTSGTLAGTDGWLPMNVQGRNFWSFSGQAGQIVNIQGERLDSGLDPALSLYLGTTNVDESLFAAAGDFGGMTWLTTRDDSIEDPFGGPFMDPLLENFVLPADGQYTIAVYSNQSTDGDHSYRLTLFDNSAVISEPSTVLVLGAGLIGMAMWRRRQVKAA